MTDTHGDQPGQINDSGGRELETSLSDTHLYGDIDHHGHMPQVVHTDSLTKPDVVLVYEKHTGDHENEKHEKHRAFYQDELRKQGLRVDTEEVRVGDDELVFVKVTGVFDTLCAQAEELHLNVPVKMKTKLEPPQKTFIDNLLANLPGYNPQVYDRARPTDICWPFEHKILSLCAFNNESSFFTPTQRIEMVWEIMQNTRCDPDNPKTRGVEHLTEEGIFECAYPLHDGDLDKSAPSGGKYRNIREELADTWAGWKCAFKTQPINLIRYYFGESAGYYFAYLDFYTKALILPSIAGICCFIYGVVKSSPIVDRLCDDTQSPGNEYMCPICAPPNCELYEISGHEGCDKAKWEYRFDTHAIMFMSSFICIWAPLFLKLWKRKEARLAYEWNTYNMVHHFEPNRPQYDYHATEEKPDPVTGEIEPHIPDKTILWRRAVSNIITACILVFLSMCLCLLVISRIALYKGFHDLGGYFEHTNIEWSRWTIHGCIFIMVTIAEVIYHPIAHKLTNFERPRTDSQFHHTFLWKLFVFELLNEMLPIFYAAFIKGNFFNTPADLNMVHEFCELGGCLGEVVELTAVLLLARLVVGNFMEIGMPAIKKAIHKCRHTNDNKVKNVQGVAGQHVHDFALGEVEGDGVSEEMMEMMVQFAFTTILIPALPLAPVLCLLNNILEIRVDAMNFLRYHRRPLPERIKSLDIWNHFQDIIIKVAVLINAALISFTSEVPMKIYYYNKYGTYDGFTDFMLTKYNVADWTGHAEELLHENHTYCYFQDLRDDVKYELTIEWWQVQVLRMSMFTGFVIVAYAVQWLINKLISDTPRDIEVQILRKEFLVKKAIESQQKRTGTAGGLFEHAMEEGVAPGNGELEHFDY